MAISTRSSRAVANFDTVELTYIVRLLETEVECNENPMAEALAARIKRVLLPLSKGAIYELRS